MDELDRKLLNELQSRGYQKISILAPLLGVGERTIRRRIRAMISKETIKIIAMPNPLSEHVAWAKIGIKVEPRRLFYVAQKLIEHPSVYFVACSLGTFNIIIAVHFDSMDKLTYFVNSELTKIKGILATEPMILTCPRKYYNFSWPEPVFEERSNGQQPHHHVTTSPSIYKIDDTDRRIINVLMEDAHAPVRLLKSRLGLGESTIRKRIKQMLKEGVFKIEVVPNPELLEHEIWATMGLIINHRSTHKVINAIIEDPAVYLASVSISRFNIVIAARFHNIDSLNQFINMKLAKIEGVSAIEIFLHTKPLKYHNIKMV